VSPPNPSRDPVSELVASLAEPADPSVISGVASSIHRRTAARQMTDLCSTGFLSVCVELLGFLLCQFEESQPNPEESHDGQ
jgi:hypothetical protein